MSNVPTVIEPNCVRDADNSTVELFAGSISGGSDPQEKIYSISFKIKKNNEPQSIYILDNINEEVPSIISHTFNMAVSDSDTLEWEITATSYQGSSSSGVGVNIYGDFSEIDAQLFVAHIGSFGIIFTEDLGDSLGIIETENLNSTDGIIVTENFIQATAVKTNIV